MRVLFIGTGEIGVPVLRWLIESPEHELIGVVTQPDKPVGREQRIEAPPIKTALAGHDVPVFQPKRIKSEETVAEIRALAPGGTVMYMDEGLDTGDVLLETRIEIAPDETGGSLHDRLAEIAPGALKEALAQLQAGTAPRISQDSSAATYAPKLEREHGRIDWSEPAQLIERKIRAFNPWPGAFTKISTKSGKPKKLKIFSAALTALAERPRRTFVVDGDVVVTAGEDAIAIAEVQLEGGRRMTAREFIRGHHLFVQP